MNLAGILGRDDSTVKNSEFLMQDAYYRGGFDLEGFDCRRQPMIFGVTATTNKRAYVNAVYAVDGARHDPEIAKAVRELSDNGKRAIFDFIPPLYSSTEFSPGSTDVGDVSWLTPTSQIVTTCWPSGVPGHSWQIVACGKSGLAHKGMLLAGKVLAATAIDLLTDAALLEAATAEFAERSAEGYVCPIEPDAVPIAL